MKARTQTREPWMSPEKVTLKLGYDQHHLHAWSGSVHTWIESSGNGEPCVMKAPVIGNVPSVMFTWGKALLIVQSLPSNMRKLLADGWAVVVRRDELPEFARMLI